MKKWNSIPTPLLTNVVATPVFPDLPVRPILCTEKTTKQMNVNFCK